MSQQIERQLQEKNEALYEFTYKKFVINFESLFDFSTFFEIIGESKKLVNEPTAGLRLLIIKTPREATAIASLVAKFE